MATEAIHDDITHKTDRFVRLSDCGGSPVLDFRPKTVSEMEIEGETFPKEPLVEITFPNGQTGEYCPEALRAVLDAVEELRDDSASRGGEPPSNERMDQAAYAVQAIHEATRIISGHYHDATEWPGWDEDAMTTVRLATELLMMSVSRATQEDRPDAS